jgi:hypothetical protein
MKHPLTPSPLQNAGERVEEALIRYSLKLFRCLESLGCNTAGLWNILVLLEARQETLERDLSSTVKLFPNVPIQNIFGLGLA